MEITLPVIGGLILGLIVGFVVMNFFVRKMQNTKIEEMNQKADLTLKEAKLTAQRLIEEADSKAEKITAKAENKNELIKQKKIQEAKQKYLYFSWMEYFVGDSAFENSFFLVS